MCDINKKTDLKSITVYKAVLKHKGSYYSFFSGLKIKRGKVIRNHTLSKFKDAIYPDVEVDIGDYFRVRDYKEMSTLFYNSHMVGKTSGFINKKCAKSLIEGKGKGTVLKITLGGEIWKGTAKDISCRIPDRARTFAGTRIISFEEI